ncbi:uncharacterized protein PADG_06307 [Paracoccidioides brasiliensis Pb18]|uniref:RING-type domain-containing protein n=2 Tax=Paracoccidioides brasiliensis TaxID=121759 RepID=C1GG70_PARBD|nr:uncharacterized protein PADG_06307 [Paracoccidioides brasiliensis Pb18]EEH50228.1 hypothetical protein PADG_06307 [Paracoccidioides brasiliensis Pb18]ODH38210.1 hypothetical protein ACO22_02484 [Paracoccidioides brasiliensis]
MTPAHSMYCLPTLSIEELDHARMRCFSGIPIEKDGLKGQMQEIGCILCFEDLDCDTRFRELPCQHIFHKPCIDNWMTQRDASCPLCRRTYYHLKQPNSPLATQPNTHPRGVELSVANLIRNGHPRLQASSSSELNVTSRETAHCSGPWEALKWWRRHRQRRRTAIDNTIAAREYLRNGG